MLRRFLRGENKDKNMNEGETLRWLVALFRPMIGLLILASLGQAVVSGMAVLGAFCSRDVVDAATEGSKERFVVAAVVLLGVLSFVALVALLNQAWTERLRAKTGVALQKRSFGILMRKDFSEVTSRHSGDLLNRLTSDVKVVTDGASTIIPSLVSLISRLLFAFAALCYFDWRLASVFFTAGVFIFTATFFVRKTLKTLHKAMQEAEGKKRSFWQEAFENLFVIKAFSREQDVERRSNGLLDAHFKATMKRRNFGLILGGAVRAVFTFGYFGAMIWQAYLVLLGESTFGSMTAVLLLINNVQSPFSGLSGLIPRYYNAMASAERIRELETLRDEDGSMAKRIEPTRIYDDIESIVFENASFKYRRGEQDVNVLENVSFEIPVKKRVAISGRSGIGKSTIFKLLIGVYRLDSGRVFLRLRSGDEIPIDARTRPLFAVVPQGNMLFSGTIAENLAFFHEPENEQKLQNAARIARAEFIEETAGAYETALGENGAGLSEGQIQRLAIARAVLTDSPILLLDEATSALDDKTERDVLTRIAANTNKTLVLISHRIAAFEFADVEVKLDGKNVTVKDTVKNIA